jgi:hypothetical protein
MPGTGAVTAYETANYAGYSSELKLGAYNAAALLDKAGFEPQSIEALKITAGFKVVLFSEDNFAGDSLVLTADNASLAAWADRAVSLKVLAGDAGFTEGIYQIKQATGGNAITMDGDYTHAENGQKARLARSLENINMQFRFTRQNDGSYRIQPLSSGKSWEIADF